jgi:hypothetical protein
MALITKLIDNLAATGVSSAVYAQRVDDRKAIVQVRTAATPPVGVTIYVEGRMTEESVSNWARLATITQADIGNAGTYAVEVPVMPIMRVNVSVNSAPTTINAWIDF